MGKSAITLVVGGGGSGSCFVQDWVRFAPSWVTIAVMDGDKVESKNCQRQMFAAGHVDLHKAEALSEQVEAALAQGKSARRLARPIRGVRYVSRSIEWPFAARDVGRNRAFSLVAKASGALGTRRVWAVTDYVEDTRQLHDLTKGFGEVLLVMAVDNHPARLVAEQFFREAPSPVYLLDLANGRSDGEVIATYGCRDWMVGALRSHWDRSVLTDKSGDPTKSCSQSLATGNTQTLIANRKSAILGVELAWQYMTRAPGTVPITGYCFFEDCVVRQVIA